MAALVFSLMGVAGAAAQEDAGPVSVRVRVLRPPEGSMRRGVYAMPEWAVYATGGVLAACAAGFLVWRATRKR